MLAVLLGLVVGAINWLGRAGAQGPQSRASFATWSPILFSCSYSRHLSPTSSRVQLPAMATFAGQSSARRWPSRSQPSCLAWLLFSRCRRHPVIRQQRCTLARSSAMPCGPVVLASACLLWRTQEHLYECLTQRAVRGRTVIAPQHRVAADGRAGCFGEVLQRGHARS